jgi:hypothetical protein
MPVQRFGAYPLAFFHVNPVRRIESIQFRLWTWFEQIQLSLIKPGRMPGNNRRNSSSHLQSGRWPIRSHCFVQEGAKNNYEFPAATHCRLGRLDRFKPLGSPQAGDQYLNVFLVWNRRFR